MRNYFDNSNIFANFGAWIGGSCKPSDKEKLTLFPRFTFCQQNFKNVSNMLRFEELPKVNSERWLSLDDLDGEIWREVAGYPLYLISNYSRIKSLFRPSNPRILRPVKNYGYWKVTLSKNGKNELHSKCVHRIMAETFIPNPYNLPQVNHKDENKEHNLIANLEWCTNSYNMNYGTRNAKAAIGISYANSIQIAQYSLDGKYIASYRGINEASRILGLNIFRPLNGWKSQFSQSCGYMWRLYEEGVDMTQDIPPYFQLSASTTLLEQYTLEDEYVACYISTICASKKTGINRDHIKQCAYGKKESAGGYKWKFLGKESLYEGVVFDKDGVGTKILGYKNRDDTDYKQLKKRKERRKIW